MEKNVITQLNVNISPEESIWQTLEPLPHKVSGSLRKHVGDNMGFRPLFSPHGTHYINRMQSTYVRFVNLIAIRYYDSFRERHQFCKQTDETQEYNSIFSKLKRLFKRS